jgi:glutamate racemase
MVALAAWKKLSLSKPRKTPEQQVIRVMATASSTSLSHDRRNKLLVFDSGTGGLGIVAALRQHLPDVIIHYIADTAFFPYGDQPDEQLIAHILSLIQDATARLRPDAVVIACNTASTLALNALRQTINIPVIGCVPPIRWAARLSQTRCIGLLATPATVKRPYVSWLREAYAPDCQLIAHGARRLASLAERRFRGQEVSLEAIAQEILPLFQQKDGNLIDVVALGCTHYPFLLPELERLSPSTAIRWLDPANAVASRTAEIVQNIAPIHAATDPDGFWMTAVDPDVNILSRAIGHYGFNAASLWPAC